MAGRRRVKFSVDQGLETAVGFGGSLLIIYEKFIGSGFVIAGSVAEENIGGAGSVGVAGLRADFDIIGSRCIVVAGLSSLEYVVVS